MIVNSLVRLLIIFTDMLISVLIIEGSLFLLQDIIAFMQFFITPLCFTAHLFHNRGLQPSSITKLSLLIGIFISILFMLSMYQLRDMVSFYPLLVTIVACLLIRDLATRKNETKVSDYFLFYFLVKNFLLLLLISMSLVHESIAYLSSFVISWLCLITFKRRIPNSCRFEPFENGRFLQFYGLSLLAQFIVQGEVIYLLLLKPGDEVAIYRLLLQFVLVGNIAQQVVNQTYIRKISKISGHQSQDLWFFGKKSVLLGAAIYTSIFLLLAGISMIDAGRNFIFTDLPILAITSLPIVNLYAASAMMLLMYAMGPIITVAKLNLSNIEVTTIFFFGMILKFTTCVIILKFFSASALVISGPGCMLVVSLLLKFRLNKSLKPE